MDTLLTAAISKRNVAVLSMQGLERSRFFLRFSLNLLARRPGAKIYHVLDNDRLVRRVQNEAATMPFDHFGSIGINLILCTTTSLYQQMPESAKSNDLKNATNVIIYDIVSLDSLEGTIIELQPLKPDVADSLLSEITRRFDITTTILASNGPLDGVESDLSIKLHNVISYNCLQAQQRGSASFCDDSMWPSGDNNQFIELDDKDVSNRAKLHNNVGQMLEKISSSPCSGRIVVFFPTYGKMVEFHNAWKQLGVFDRIGLPYARENRGGDHFKNALKDLATRDRSILLCSIRYHQDEELAEMVLGQVETFVIVGLPYPIMSDTWALRMSRHDELNRVDKNLRYPATLSGSELYKSRAIDFMNGIIKRCLFNAYRSKSCHFLILGELNMREVYRHKLVSELGDIQSWPQTFP